MYTAELRFKINREHEAEERDAAVDFLLGSLRQNGQVLGREFPYAHVGKSVRAFVMLPEASSLVESHHNKYVQKALSALTEVGLDRPHVTLLDADSAEPEKKTIHEFILYTNYLALESPLRSGATFSPVPLYSIPPTYDNCEYYDILCWQSDYQACDTLQMNCVTGERFALRQMSDVHSSLSERGRMICDHITELTSLPTYYYLHRYKLRTQWRKEIQRRCPNCGGTWLLDQSWHLFDFKCDACRLLSVVSPGATKDAV